MMAASEWLSYTDIVLSELMVGTWMEETFV